MEACCGAESCASGCGKCRLRLESVYSKRCMASALKRTLMDEKKSTPSMVLILYSKPVSILSFEKIL